MLKYIPKAEQILLTREEIDEIYDGYWVAVDVEGVADDFFGGIPKILGDSFEEVDDAAITVNMREVKLQCANKNRWEGTACLN